MKISRNEFLNKYLAHLFVTIGLASTLIVRGGYTYWPLLMSVWGLTILFRSGYPKNGWLANSESSRSAFWILSAFGFFITSSVAINVYHGEQIGVYQTILPFLVYPLLFFAIYTKGITPPWFFFGAALGAIGGAVIALIQFFASEGARSHGILSNPIPFGDTSIVLAAACIVPMIYLDFSKVINGERLKLLLLIGIFCGLLGSLLSGTKGGWFSIFTLFSLGLFAKTSAMSTKNRFKSLSIGVAMLVLVIALLPRHIFADRIKDGWTGLTTYVKTGEVTEMSVSIRLELWRVGLKIFAEYPVLGAGQELMHSRRLELAGTEEYSSRVSEVKTFDSEYVNRLASAGMVGFLANLFLFIAPIIAFSRYKNHPDSQIRSLAVLGMILPIIYMEFGISVDIFGTNAFRQVYSSWIVLIFSLIAVVLQRQPYIAETPKSGNNLST